MMLFWQKIILVKIDKNQLAEGILLSLIDKISWHNWYVSIIKNRTQVVCGAFVP